MKFLFGSILIGAFLFGGYIVTRIIQSNQESVVPAVLGDNVRMEDGKQIIELTAKGGYTPRMSQVRAGIPTVLRFNTKGTFDCSSQVRIPSMNINQALPNSGVTDIDLGVLKTGTLEGNCGMGMYPFTIGVTE